MTVERSIVDPVDFYALLRALGAIAAQPGDSLTRVERVTAAIADPAYSLQSGNAVKALLKLLEGVVYLVVSVPLGLHRSDQRIFSAVLSPSIVLPTRRRTALSDDIEEGCTVKFFRGEHSSPGLFIRNQHSAPGLSPRKATSLQARWSSEWAIYAEVTRRLQAKDVFTWNQYMLHGCESPQPLGLVWHRPLEDGALPDYYVALTEDEAQWLGVPIQADRPGSTAWATEHESSESPGPDHCPPPFEREEVIRQWELMRPRASIHLPNTVSSGIFHLLRSYSIWGGDGFISIPSQLAISHDETATAVLSICSRPILEPDQILTWQLLAGYVFHPLFAGDLLSRYKMQSLVYELGHPVKHRAQRVASLAVLTRRIVSAVADAEEKSGGAHYAELRKASNLITMVERYATSARAYGEMANLFASCISAGGWEGLLTKSEWHSEEAFTILDPLRGAFGLASNKDDARIVPVPTFSESLENYLVVPWLRGDGRVIAPAPLVYQHIFSELADNVANHGHCVEEKLCVYADIRVEELREDLRAIIIRNAVPKDPENSDDRGPYHVLADFAEVRPGQATGASLAARVLRDMGIGLLERRFIPLEPVDARIVGYWEYRVLLNGLRARGKDK